MTKITDNSSIMNTFTAAYPGFEKNEERYVDLLVGRLGINNEKIYPDEKTLMRDMQNFIYHQEEPVRSTSQYSQYCVMKLAHKHGLKVLLDGQGSDEIFGGYDYFFGGACHSLVPSGLRIVLYRWRSSRQLLCQIFAVFTYRFGTARGRVGLAVSVVG